MKVNWIALAIVAAIGFCFPSSLIAASSDHSGAGMAALGYMLFVVPPVLLVAIIAQIVMINTRFRAYPTYVLTGIVASALGVWFIG